MSTPLSFLNSGDFSYDIQLKEIVDNCVLIDLTCYSRKYLFLDIELELKNTFQEVWRTDLELDSDSPIIINKNKLFNLPASNFGKTTEIKLKLPEYYIGHSIEIRAKLLTRFLSFGDSGVYSTISESNENILVYKEGIDKKVINYSNDLNLICLTDNGIFLYKKLGALPIASYTLLSNPKFAIQIGDNFLIADSNGITELDQNLNYVRYEEISDAIYLDYNEELNTVLVTRSIPLVEEYTWGNGNYGYLIWSYSDSLSNPVSATYKKDNASVILISDVGHNRVIQEDRVNQISKSFISQTIYKNDGNDTTLFNLTTPFKAVAVGEDVHIFEKEANNLEFYDYDGSPIYPLGTGIIGLTFLIT